LAGRSVTPGASGRLAAAVLDDYQTLTPFDVVVAIRRRTALRETLLARLPRLRLIVTRGTRNAVIDVDAARRHGIEVCGSDSLPGDTAEHTWLLILAALRNLPEEVEIARAGGWQTDLGTSRGASR
jgi:lactate dehydrogenase-like 2-hydroxyacid dehydrogenase